MFFWGVLSYFFNSFFRESNLICKDCFRASYLNFKGLFEGILSTGLKIFVEGSLCYSQRLFAGAPILISEASLRGSYLTFEGFLRGAYLICKSVFWGDPILFSKTFWMGSYLICLRHCWRNPILFLKTSYKGSGKRQENRLAQTMSFSCRFARPWKSFDCPGSSCMLLLFSNEGFKIALHKVSKGSYPCSKPTREDPILAYTLFHCSWRKARAQRARYMRERSERHVSSDF